MINFKVCGIAAGIAFVLSLIIGLVSGSGFVVLLLRAIVFAGVFFALSGLGFWIVSRFLPELLSEGTGDDLDIPAPGSRVDISEGSSLEGAFPEDASESVDDIAGMPSAVRKEPGSPLDQNEDSGYNEGRDFIGDLGGMVMPESSKDIGGEALPDMDNLSGESSADAQEVEVEMFPSPEPRRSSSRKPVMAGDFDPKELAKAIQTTLKRDEKG